MRGRTAASMTPALAAVGLLFGGALLGAVRSSLRSDPLGELGPEAWWWLLRSPGLVDSFVFSARVAVLATLLSAGLAAAVGAMLRTRGALVRGLFAFPVLVPHLVVAAVAVLWLGPGGIADRLLGGLPLQVVRDRAGLGVVLVYLYKEVPFLVLVVLASWREAVAEREEAAAVLGAGPWQRFRWVVWPAIRAPLVAGSLIVAAFAFGSFEVPLVVGPTHPPTLAVFALETAKSADPAGLARAAAVLLFTALAALLAALAALPRAWGGDA